MVEGEKKKVWDHLELKMKVIPFYLRTILLCTYLMSMNKYTVGDKGMGMRYLSKVSSPTPRYIFRYI